MACGRVHVWLKKVGEERGGRDGGSEFVVVVGKMYMFNVLRSNSV